MKTSTILIVLVLVILAGGGFWYWSNQANMSPAVATTPTADTTQAGGTDQAQTAGGPNHAAGINGSPNQGNMGQPDNGTPQQPAGDGTTAGQNLTLGINADAKLGSFLSAYNGMTLYTFAKDKTGTSTCYGTCATNWPPYTVTAASDLHISSTIKGKLDTIKRTDGTLQVTYNGMPLYYFAKDKKPGDTTGQNVGGVWIVAKS